MGIAWTDVERVAFSEVLHEAIEAVALRQTEVCHRVNDYIDAVRELPTARLELHPSWRTVRHITETDLSLYLRPSLTRQAMKGRHQPMASRVAQVSSAARKNRTPRPTPALIEALSAACTYLHGTTSLYEVSGNPPPRANRRHNLYVADLRERGPGLFARASTSTKKWALIYAAHAEGKELKERFRHADALTYLELGRQWLEQLAPQSVVQGWCLYDTASCRAAVGDLEGAAHDYKRAQDIHEAYGDAANIRQVDLIAIELQRLRARQLHDETDAAVLAGGIASAGFAFMELQSCYAALATLQHAYESDAVGEAASREVVAMPANAYLLRMRAEVALWVARSAYRLLGAAPGEHARLGPAGSTALGDAMACAAQAVVLDEHAGNVHSSGLADSYYYLALAHEARSAMEAWSTDTVALAEGEALRNRYARLSAQIYDVLDSTPGRSRAERLLVAHEDGGTTAQQDRDERELWLQQYVAVAAYVRECSSADLVEMGVPNGDLEAHFTAVRLGQAAPLESLVSLLAKHRHWARREVVTLRRILHPSPGYGIDADWATCASIMRELAQTMGGFNQLARLCFAENDRQVTAWAAKLRRWTTDGAPGSKPAAPRQPFDLERLIVCLRQRQWPDHDVAAVVALQRAWSNNHDASLAGTAPEINPHFPGPRLAQLEITLALAAPDERSDLARVCDQETASRVLLLADAGEYDMAIKWTLFLLCDVLGDGYDRHSIDTKRYLVELLLRRARDASYLMPLVTHLDAEDARRMNGVLENLIAERHRRHATDAAFWDLLAIASMRLHQLLATALSDLSARTGALAHQAQAIMDDLQQQVDAYYDVGVGEGDIDPWHYLLQAEVVLLSGHLDTAIGPIRRALAATRWRSGDPAWSYLHAHALFLQARLLSAQGKPKAAAKVGRRARQTFVRFGKAWHYRDIVDQWLDTA